MLRTVVPLLGVTALTAVVLTPATGQEPTTVPPTQPPPVAVASTRFVHPPRVVHRTVRFAPPAHPSVSFVLNTIVPYEAARAGVSAAHLRNRVICESGGRWWAQNGSYHGIGQFASSTFWRGVSTLGSRSIGLVTVHSRHRPVWRIRTFTDGTVQRVARWKQRQRVVVVHHGHLRVTAYDPWVEARIMAQAMAGRSAVHDSEWSCR